MFPKCSLDIQNIATLREHSANIPEILRAGWIMPAYIVICPGDQQDSLC